MLGNSTAVCEHTHLAWMPWPVSTAIHVASASPAHVTSVHGAASVHGCASWAHAAPHGTTSGRAAQTGKGAAAAVSTAGGESSSEGWRRQEAAGWAVETTTRTGNYRPIRAQQIFSPVSICLFNYINNYIHKQITIPPLKPPPPPLGKPPRFPPLCPGPPPRPNWFLPPRPPPPRWPPPLFGVVLPWLGFFSAGRAVLLSSLYCSSSLATFSFSISA